MPKKNRSTAAKRVRASSRPGEKYIVALRREQAPSTAANRAWSSSASAVSMVNAMMRQHHATLFPKLGAISPTNKELAEAARKLFAPQPGIRLVGSNAAQSIIQKQLEAMMAPTRLAAAAAAASAFKTPESFLKIDPPIFSLHAAAEELAGLFKVKVPAVVAQPTTAAVIREMQRQVVFGSRPAKRRSDD